MLTAEKTRTGLCTTCSLVQTCTFPVKSDRPVIFCEEFDGLLRNGHVENPDVDALLAYANVKPRRATLKGLCVNCAVADNCAYPRAEGGIWHCEEYR